MFIFAQAIVERGVKSTRFHLRFFNIQVYLALQVTFDWFKRKHDTFEENYTVPKENSNLAEQLTKKIL